MNHKPFVLDVRYGAVISITERGKPHNGVSKTFSQASLQDALGYLESLKGESPVELNLYGFVRPEKAPQGLTVLQFKKLEKVHGFKVKYH